MALIMNYFSNKVFLKIKSLKKKKKKKSPDPPEHASSGCPGRWNTYIIFIYLLFIIV